LKAEILNIQIHDAGDSTVLQGGEKGGLYCRVERRVDCTAGWREGWLFFYTDSHSFFAGYFQEMRRAFCIPNRNKISDFFVFLKIISV